MKRIVIQYILPWSITALLLYLAFRDIEWSSLYSHLIECRVEWLLVAVLLTVLSYIIRSLRWPKLFPEKAPNFKDSYRVLLLGFFMNNVLPARAGELVRAHLGSKVTGASRTLVLATIASERIADGVTISLLVSVTLWLWGSAGLDPAYASGMNWVALAFAAVSGGVITVLAFEQRIINVIRRFSNSSLKFLLVRAEIFLSGLKPLMNPKNTISLVLWSAAVWIIELAVFWSVGEAAGFSLNSSSAILFLAAVNFSSLIPSAPGGFGVIEFIAKHVLLSLGVPSEEQALTMVLVQHLIQYAVVGIPGAIFMVTWKRGENSSPTEGIVGSSVILK